MRSERAASPWFPVGEDSVQLLRDGVQAFPAMLGAIARAEREVLLEMYWVGADACGERFRGALTDAARRGVTVRVIYDAVGSIDITPGWWGSLREAGGEVNVFHPFSPLMRGFGWRFLEERDHRKMLVVDGLIGFTGGVNLGNPWLPIEEGGQGWRDDVIAVRGPCAGELRTLFFRTRRRLTRDPPPKDLRPIARNSTRPVRVLTTRALPRRRIHREYVLHIRRARERVDIANPYFIPDRAVRRALFGAVARGAKVRVLLPERGDVPFVHLAMEATFDTLLRHGVELYTMAGPMMHAKTAIIDDDFATIGSYNLDERSWRKNLEVNIAVEDSAFPKHVRRWFEHDLERSKRIDPSTWSDRSRSRRAGEWVALALRKLW
jgi:cardiolipin synthase